MPVAPGYELEVGEDVMLCEETEFDLVAGDIEEDGFGLENLSEDGVGQVGETRAGDAHEGEGDGKEGDGNVG